MMQKVFSDGNYALMLEEHYNVLAKEQIRRYEVVPQRDCFLMQIEVLGDGFYARFPSGISFTGRDGNLWVQAIRNAEVFIEKAKVAVQQRDCGESERRPVNER